MPLYGYRNIDGGVKVSEHDRLALINQMGFSMGSYSLAAVRREWPIARAHLNKIVAGLGMLAMEIDENDPVERES